MTDFHRSDEILKVGEAAAEQAVDKIKSLLPYFAHACQVPIGPRHRGVVVRASPLDGHNL